MTDSLDTIFTAAERNDIPALKRHLETTSPNVRDGSGLTPLHYAASTLSMRALETLLQHPDTDATLSDNFGRSASTVAVESWGALSDDCAEMLDPHCYPWLYTEQPDA